MRCLPVNIFRKSANCPASEALLAYRRSQAARGEKAFVKAHLAVCEFCGAELQLLERYGYGAEETEVAQMPADLRRLAEELLPKSMMRISSAAGVVESHQLSH